MADKKTRDPLNNSTIHLRIFIAVIFAAVFIVVCGLGAGTLLLTHSIGNSVKDDMPVVVDDILIGIILICVLAVILSIITAVFAASFLKRPFTEADNLRREEEIASISKSTFLANMSHEIRTPMNSIIGFSELAMDNDIPNKTRDYLKKIQTNAQWLLQIINDILDISKIESGKMELEKIPFDIHELFSSCRTLVMPQAVEKGLMLHFYAEPSIGKMPLGDPARLRQVIVNLLTNAIKFTNSGMVKLLTEIKSINDKIITMNFEVKDSGIGMTDEQIKKIFDPFMQVEAGITRKFGGTGLGLPITKNIIEMMGGTLFVESTHGVGSKFSFELTFDVVKADESEKRDKELMFKKIEKPVFDGEILLCEDNEMNQKVISDHLARVNLKAVIAENGRIGIEKVEKRRINGEKQFDLIFMDIQMPVMSGLEASAEIVKLNMGIPIIAMTANAMDSDREAYKTIGMNDCIGKPFSSQELWRCLLKYLTPVSMGNDDKDTSLEKNMDFQKNIKIMFVKNNSGKFNEIAEALNKNDIELAHRLAHTLKSNAGQIGKTLLRQAAENVEFQLKDGKNLVSGEQLRILEKEMNDVLNEISALVDDSAVPASETKIPVFDSEEKLELLRRLKPMIESGNPECLKYINDLRAVSESDLLIQQLENYEFEAAFLSLEELMLK
jgi:signal transduction histidine kinase/CheY-like chemotaxis protein